MVVIESVGRGEPLPQAGFGDLANRVLGKVVEAVISTGSLYLGNDCSPISSTRSSVSARNSGNAGRFMCAPRWQRIV
jgi:hypothetical protein